MHQTIQRIVKVIQKNYSYEEVYNECVNLKKEELKKLDTEEERIVRRDLYEDAFYFFNIIRKEKDIEKAIDYFYTLDKEQKKFLSLLGLYLYFDAD